jgi:manganese/zinc/iron transport system permease protein
MTAVCIIGQDSTGAALLRVLTLSDHNTRVVILGVTMLGLACGVVGSLMLLRRRALLGDALSHATLPGIGLAFMVGVAAWGEGKSMPLLLTGAAIAGACGVACVLLIRRLTHLKEDAAMGIVLSVFFGAGVAVLGVVQQMQAGSAAGLESFIYGKTASMLGREALGIVAVAGLVALVVAVMFKEFRLLCFDEGFARAEGWPVLLLDSGLMALVTLVTVIGLSSVGLILVIAMLVIPPAAARFWVNRMGAMTVVAAGVGAVGGAVGAALSATFSKLPSGAMIVLTTAGLFAVSMIFGTARGLAPRAVEAGRNRRRAERQHVLRGLYELEESGACPTIGSVAQQRGWKEAQAQRLVRRAEAARLVRREGARVCLTRSGRAEAERITRNHRLWEAYLIHYADVAPSHVDRDADEIEHVLGEEMVAKLERLVEEGSQEVPASPHAILGAEAKA